MLPSQLGAIPLGLLVLKPSNLQFMPLLLELKPLALCLVESLYGLVESLQFTDGSELVLARLLHLSQHRATLLNASRVSDEVEPPLVRLDRGGYRKHVTHAVQAIPRHMTHKKRSGPESAGRTRVLRWQASSVSNQPEQRETSGQVYPVGRRG